MGRDGMGRDRMGWDAVSSDDVLGWSGLFGRRGGGVEKVEEVGAECGGVISDDDGA